METEEFVGRLEAMTRFEILAVADAVEHHTDTVDGEVGWWRATVAVESSLRAQRRCREASRISRDAARAVMRAAHRAGMDDAERAMAVRVARAASDAARGLASGASPESRAALLGPFGITAMVA